jgi:carbon-monoxide dehydrogenase large subunit
VSIQQVAFAAYVPHKYPTGLEPGLEATSFFDPSNFTWPFGSHVAVVEVDPETGVVKIRRYVAVDDCGKVINPLLVDGQIQGGLAQGIAQALFEEAVYDENGQLISGSLMDYVVPKAHHLLNFELDRTETPSPVNALGVKGIGEAGTIASSATIVNAVVDALAPLGVTHIDMPLKPERVWQAIQQAQARR